MMLVKYSLPMLFLWLGYSGLRNEKDLIIFLKVVNIAACVYCFFIGGQGYKLMPWLYYGPIGGQFLKYAGFADFLTSIFVVPIMLYWLTKEKKYIFCALWMVLSTVLESVRTGMGGMLLVFCTALLLKNKAKAIPGLAVAGAMFLSVVLFVPSVNEKFFGEDAGTVSATDIVQGDAMSMDNIEMSGREYMWERVMDNCYYGNETFGGGLGTSGRFVKNYGEATQGLVMMHNDYLQILCDTGIVGIVLIILFYLSVVLKVTSNVALRRSSTLVKLTGIMALSSLAGIAFSMYFDNVVSNSMQSMVMPYIYIGFFLKALDLEKRSSNEVAAVKG
jgi:O-antigen ligase